MGAVLSDHPHEPLAAPDLALEEISRHAPPRPAQMSVLGAITVLAGLVIVVGGLLLWRFPPHSPGWLVGPSAVGVGPWLYWGGVACGGIIVLLGGALIRWPDHHATFGVGIVVAGGMSL